MCKHERQQNGEAEQWAGPRVEQGTYNNFQCINYLKWKDAALCGNRLAALHV